MTHRNHASKRNRYVLRNDEVASLKGGMLWQKGRQSTNVEQNYVEENGVYYEVLPNGILWCIGPA